MMQRLNPSVVPEGYAALRRVEAYLQASGLDHKLTALVKTRVSQMNGCAYCLHMHTQEALKLGESSARLFLLDAWHESHLYSERERAALAWAEALTNIAMSHAPDDVYDETDEYEAPSFTAEELEGLDRGGGPRRFLPLEDEPTTLVARYLFPTERYRGEWKRHWIHLAKPIGIGAGATLLLGYLAGFLTKQDIDGLVTVAVLIWRRAIRLYCEAVASAASSGKAGGAQARGEDVGAMAEPPVEAALAE